MDAWSWTDGILRRTPWTMRHTGVRPRPGGTTIVLGERHAMATELRALGLPKRAALTTVVEQVTASFGEATIVARGRAGRVSVATDVHPGGGGRHGTDAGRLPAEGVDEVALAVGGHARGQRPSECSRRPERVEGGEQLVAPAVVDVDLPVQRGGGRRRHRGARRSTIVASSVR